MTGINTSPLCHNILYKTLPEERVETRYEEQGMQMALTDREEDGGTWERKKGGEKETGRGGDSGESEVVPVWREKALCCLSVDRLVKLRRAQGHRPEGFTGLCSFLCGSSVSTTTDPPIPAWCPLRVQLHD